MTDTAGTGKRQTTANRSAVPITVGLGGLILGAGLFSVGGSGAMAVAVVIGSAVFLIGLVALLDGVHKLVQNLDSATQAILEQRSAPPAS
ncbi:hypothetical protein ACFS27_18330 [Promicromonospora vindobonensis]|uniref:Superfamily III holin-X n=1 Tax=Promicromonospora vindobonensis TaxID=195748 RepID=A0ABW5VV15_9MICO